MSITPITLRIDTSAFEERMANFREHFRQYLEEREVQNEGRNEDHGSAGRREGDVGHGCEGTGGFGGEEVRRTTAEWISTHSFPVCNQTVYIRGDNGEEVARFRPIGGEDRDDPPYAGWISYTAIWDIPEWQRRFYMDDEWAGPNRPNYKAEERAEALLLEHLDGEQTESWKNDSSFDVIAQGGGTYKIDAQAQSVTDHANGVWYCLQPCDSMIPSPDVALAHKLWLEADEAGFLKAANCFSLRLERSALYDYFAANAPVVTHDESDIVFRVEDDSCL